MNLLSQSWNIMSSLEKGHFFLASSEYSCTPCWSTFRARLHSLLPLQIGITWDLTTPPRRRQSTSSIIDANTPVATIHYSLPVMPNVDQSHQWWICKLIPAIWNQRMGQTILGSIDWLFSQVRDHQKDNQQGWLTGTSDESRVPALQKLVHCRTILEVLKQI